MVNQIVVLAYEAQKPVGWNSLLVGIGLVILGGALFATRSLQRRLYAMLSIRSPWVVNLYLYFPITFFVVIGSVIILETFVNAINGRF